MVESYSMCNDLTSEVDEVRAAVDHLVSKVLLYLKSSNHPRLAREVYELYENWQTCGDPGFMLGRIETITGLRI